MNVMRGKPLVQLCRKLHSLADALPFVSCGSTRVSMTSCVILLCVVFRIEIRARWVARNKLRTTKKQREREIYNILYKTTTTAMRVS